MKKQCVSPLLKTILTITVLFSLLNLTLEGANSTDGSEKLPNYHLRELDAREIADFINQVITDQEKQLQELKNKYPNKSKQIEENPEMIAYARILRLASELADNVGKGNCGPEQKEKFVNLQRLHYGALTELGSASSPISGVREILGMKVVKVPRPKVLDTPIGIGAAQLESDNLIDPKTGKRVSLEELAKMNHLGISRLEPSSENHWIYGKPANGRFPAFVQENFDLIRSLGGKLGRFDLGFAKKVLFYDGLNADDTAPKITTLDRYGNKWKVKWGDETHSNIIATRLYIEVGGSFTDLKFHSGPGETIIILTSPDSKDSSEPKTVADLEELLLKSKFKFRLAPYYIDPKDMLKNAQGKLLGNGLIDKEMAKRESIPEKYVGAYFFKVKEAQLTLYNPAFKQLGGAALSTVGAEKNRFTRSSMIFNCWIKNWDVKDGNTHTGLLYNSVTEQFDRQTEYFSDLGIAMGTLILGGVVNAIEPSFVKLLPGSINFNFRTMFYPKSWKLCTYADARWMALKIASLKRGDFEQIVAESGWPVFVQKVVVEKLISRRNELAKAFNLELDGISIILCDPNLTITANYKGTQDSPIINGKINSNSQMVKDLEADCHPEGLAKVINRFQG
ncbi:MAG: hypothetical protein HQM08_20105 [Candidatus Riflebacteria bacterium]|nr:hypothetical protein [Candidatus Riflebacteria bacterium]